MDLPVLRTGEVELIILVWQKLYVNTHNVKMEYNRDWVPCQVFWFLSVLTSQSVLLTRSGSYTSPAIEDETMKNSYRNLSSRGLKIAKQIARVCIGVVCSYRNQ